MKNATLDKKTMALMATSTADREPTARADQGPTVLADQEPTSSWLTEDQNCPG